MAPDQESCPDCGNEYPRYPFEDDSADAGLAQTRQMRQSRTREGGTTPTGGGPLGVLAPYRTVLVLVGVLVLIVGLGFIIVRFGMAYFESGRPDPASQPTAISGPTPLPFGSPSPSPSPSGGTQILPSGSPSPSASPAGPVTRLKVSKTDGQGANMRQRPSTTAPVLRTLPEGAIVEAIGGDTQAEGRSWRNVRDQSGTTGWVASDLLGPE